MKIPPFFLVAVALSAVGFSPVAAQRDRAAQLNNQAILLAQEGKLSQAIALYTQALRAEENQTIFYNRAATYLRASQLTPALQDVNRVLALDPVSLDGLELRTRIYLALNRNDQALADATELLRLQPDNSQYADLRADVLFSLGRFAQALDARFYALFLVTDQKELSTLQGQNVQTALAAHYFLLGLPIFGNPAQLPAAFLETVPAPSRTLWAPRAGEVRFEGIVATDRNSKTGDWQVDVLAVSLPNGKTRVLGQPKRRLVSGKTLQLRNLSDASTEKNALRAGDFVVLTGKDSGKTISPRVIALARRTLPEQQKLTREIEKKLRDEGAASNAPRAGTPLN